MSKLKPDDFKTKDMYDKYVSDNIDAIFKPIDTDSKLQTKSEFIKLDDGKRRLSLIEPPFIQALGDVITFGAAKYAPNNWKLCEDTSRYKDALLRHIYAYLSGEQRDQETGIEHLAHASCNLMFLQYFDNKEQQ
jgi:hypothetical protein